MINLLSVHHLSEKNPRNMTQIKNIFLFPNLHTRAQKLMIKPKNNFKNLKEIGKNAFFDKIAIFVKKKNNNNKQTHKYWRK